MLAYKDYVERYCEGGVWEAVARPPTPRELADRKYLKDIDARLEFSIQGIEWQQQRFQYIDYAATSCSRCWHKRFRRGEAFCEAGIDFKNRADYCKSYMSCEEGRAQDIAKFGEIFL